MKELTGAQIVLEVLKSQGVDTVFGHPGGAILPLYDEIYKATWLKHYLVRHEQGGVHMAEGYSRSTGEVGVALATSGPGAANTVTGLVDAKMDSIPILVITAQVPRSLIAKDGFQEADVVGITIAATKHCDLVRDINDLEKTLLDAFRIIVDKRPGPVLIDIPKDVLLEKTSYPKYSTEKIKRQAKIESGDFEDAARAMCEAKRLMVYAGGGIINADASEELYKLVKLLKVPITTTLMGLGCYPGTDEQCTGMPGMHGTFSSNMALHEADCILAAGVRFDDRVTGKLETFAPHAKIVQIDVDAAEIGKNKKVDWALIGDAKPILAKLTEEVQKYLSEGHASREKALDVWWTTIRKWQKDQPLRYKKLKTVIKPQQIVEEIYTQTKNERVVIATDVGQHQMWTAQYFPFDNPREWLTSGGLGTMGYGMPAAIGAQIANPDKKVIALVGDGAFQMTMQELALLMGNRVPVKLVIFNNHFLGMVRQWQDLFYEQRFSSTDLTASPDYVLLAGAYGIASARVQNPDDLSGAIKTMLEYKGAYLLDVITDHREHVYPMVPAGGSSHEMLLQPSAEQYLD